MKKISPKKKLMTTGEFAKQAGIPATKVSKLIRDGQIEAVKVSGRWCIDPVQLEAVTARESDQRSAEKNAKAAAEAKRKTASPKKAFSVADFAALTYLTEKGVIQWLKAGRLKGQKGPQGEWSVNADSLEAADISRLVRK